MSGKRQTWKRPETQQRMQERIPRQQTPPLPAPSHPKSQYLISPTRELADGRWAQEQARQATAEAPMVTSSCWEATWWLASWPPFSSLLRIPASRQAARSRRLAAAVSQRLGMGTGTGTREHQKVESPSSTCRRSRNEDPPRIEMGSTGQGSIPAHLVA